jgi:hypothetical protein
LYPAPLWIAASYDFRIATECGGIMEEIRKITSVIEKSFQGDAVFMTAWRNYKEIFGFILSSAVQLDELNRINVKDINRFLPGSTIPARNHE